MRSAPHRGFPRAMRPLSATVSGATRGGRRRAADRPRREQPETVPVPAQQGLGSNDQQRPAPRPDPARGQDQQRPVGARGARPLRGAGQNDELLTYERVPGGERGPAPDEVGGRTPDERGRRRGRGPADEAAPERAGVSADEVAGPLGDWEEHRPCAPTTSWPRPEPPDGLGGVPSDPTVLDPRRRGTAVEARRVSTLGGWAK